METPAERARVRVLRATTAVRAALVERDRVEAGLRVVAGPRRCARLAAAGARVDAAWAALATAHAAHAGALGEPEAAREAVRTVEVERAVDAAHHSAWQARCAALPAVEPLPEPPPVPPVALCDDLVRHDDLLEWRTGAALFDRPHGGLRAARWLARRLQDELDLLFVLVHDGIDPAVAQQAAAVFERGTPGLGGAAPYDAALLPAWRRLRAVVVLDGAAGLRRGPSLRGVARASGNRLALPGCSPAGPDGGWGWSDVAGQLGGGRALEAVAPGRYRRVGGGLAANGGNAAPYAPLELYLMGLWPLEEVPPVTFLRAPRPIGGDEAEAEGTCVLDAAAIEQRFGRRPPAPEPLRAGVVVLTREPLSARAVARYRRDLAGFTRAGPDDDPDLLNFHEATGGRGRLLPHVPAPRATCATVTP